MAYVPHTSGTLSGTFPIHDSETIEQSHFAFVLFSKCKCIFMLSKILRSRDSCVFHVGSTYVYKSSDKNVLNYHFSSKLRFRANSCAFFGYFFSIFVATAGIHALLFLFSVFKLFLMPTLLLHSLQLDT